MIYLVEDDSNIREFVLYALQRQDMEARGFERPSAFFAALEQQIPELVLLDLMLPEEAGISVLKQLRKPLPIWACPTSAKNDKLQNRRIFCGGFLIAVWVSNRYNRGKELLGGVLWLDGNAFGMDRPLRGTWQRAICTPMMWKWQASAAPRS